MPLVGAQGFVDAAFFVDRFDEAGALDDPDHVSGNGAKRSFLFCRERVTGGMRHDGAERSAACHQGHCQERIWRCPGARRTHLVDRLDRERVRGALQRIAQREVSEARSQTEIRRGELQEKDRTRIGVDLRRDGLARRIEDLEGHVALHHARESLENALHWYPRVDLSTTRAGVESMFVMPRMQLVDSLTRA